MKPKFWMGNGGALICERELPGVTQDLTGDDDICYWYQGRWFVGETISVPAGKAIAEALGGELIETPKNWCELSGLDEKQAYCPGLRPYDDSEIPF